jgi:hypothetical protein
MNEVYGALITANIRYSFVTILRYPNHIKLIKYKNKYFF